MRNVWTIAVWCVVLGLVGIAVAVPGDRRDSRTWDEPKASAAGEHPQACPVGTSLEVEDPPAAGWHPAGEMGVGQMLATCRAG